jgi:molybdopterin converting factor small subunit
LTIKLRFFAALREYMGIENIEIEVESNKYTIKEVLRKIPDIKDENIKYLEKRINNLKIKVILNGNTVKNEDIEKILFTNNDELAFLPPVGGGSYQ